MRVVVMLTSGKKHDVDDDVVGRPLADMTVAEVKTLLVKHFQVSTTEEQLKLIHQGKHLKDDQVYLRNIFKEDATTKIVCLVNPLRSNVQSAVAAAEIATQPEASSAVPNSISSSSSASVPAIGSFAMRLLSSIAPSADVQRVDQLAAFSRSAAGAGIVRVPRNLNGDAARAWIGQQFNAMGNDGVSSAVEQNSEHSAADGTASSSHVNMHRSEERKEGEMKEDDQPNSSSVPVSASSTQLQDAAAFPSSIMRGAIASGSSINNALNSNLLNVLLMSPAGVALARAHENGFAEALRPSIDEVGEASRAHLVNPQNSVVDVAASGGIIEHNDPDDVPDGVPNAGLGGAAQDVARNAHAGMSSLNAALQGGDDASSIGRAFLLGILLAANEEQNENENINDENDDEDVPVNPPVDENGVPLPPDQNPQVLIPPNNNQAGMDSVLGLNGVDMLEQQEMMHAIQMMQEAVVARALIRQGAAPVPQFTPVERAHISHLQEMTGRGGLACTEAYLVCERNVDNAAMLLLS